MSEDRPWLQSYPRGVPHSLEPYPTISLFRMLEVSEARFGDQSAIAWFGHRLTYRWLLREVERFSVVLVDLGVRAGDRLALWPDRRGGEGVRRPAGRRVADGRGAPLVGLGPAPRLIRLPRAQADRVSRVAPRDDGRQGVAAGTVDGPAGSIGPPIRLPIRSWAPSGSGPSALSGPRPVLEAAYVGAPRGGVIWQDRS